MTRKGHKKLLIVRKVLFLKSYVVFVISVTLFQYRLFVIHSALNKAWKTLENEEGYKKCMEIIDEAKERVDEMVSSIKCRA